MTHVITLASEEMTARLAGQLARTASAPLVVFLEGDLGAGKTYFTRAFIRALGFKGTVKSPTYNLLESYQLLPAAVHHFDLYRFQTAVEWYEAGFNEILQTKAYHFIEWPEKICDLELTPDLRLFFSYTPAGRQLEIRHESTRGEKIITLWLKSVTAAKP